MHVKKLFSFRDMSFSQIKFISKYFHSIYSYGFRHLIFTRKRAGWRHERDEQSWTTLFLKRKRKQTQIKTFKNKYLYLGYMPTEYRQSNIPSSHYI